jgi:general secretion pathway protein B
MSLINDALKRAGADKPRDAQSAPTADMQPVDSAPATPSHVLPWALLLVGVGAVGIAAALWFRGGSTQQTAANPTPSPAAQPAPTQPAFNPIQQTTKTLQAVAARNDDGLSNPPPQPAPSTNAKNPVLLTKAPTSNIAARSPSPKKLPTTASSDAKPPRLQSIFFRMRSPSVIINGKTLGIGDSVDGIKVVSIQRTSVEVVQNGKYRTLTLQD